MSDNILTKDELSVILYWATIADIHGMAGDNAELAAKLRRMRDESSVEPLESPPVPASSAPDMLEMVCSGIRYILAEYGGYTDLGEDEWGPVKDHLMNLIPPAPGPGADDSNGGGA